MAPDVEIKVANDAQPSKVTSSEATNPTTEQ